MLKVRAPESAEISSIKAVPVEIRLNKEVPYESPVEFSADIQTFENKVIIVADDVLNTGRTFSYSLAPFLSIPVKKLQVAVLIDRNYRKFPIAADYKGYELSTTIADHVEVIVTDDVKRGVYLK